MKKIKVAKLTLNIGAGKNEDLIEERFSTVKEIITSKSYQNYYSEKNSWLGS